MTAVNYFPQYAASGLPAKNEYQLGSCVSLGIAYGMSWLALRNGIVRDLSEIFLHFTSGVLQYGPTYPTDRPIPNGRNVYIACQAATQGVASEYLWPIGICGNDDYDLCNAAQITKPSAAAYMDAPYQKLTDCAQISTWSQAEQALASGLPVGVIRQANNHFLVALGIDSAARQVLCMGSGGALGPIGYSYDEVYPVVSLRAVAFSNPPQVPLTDAMVSQLQSLLGSIPVPLTTVATPWAAQLQALAAQAQVPVPAPTPSPPTPQPSPTASPDGTLITTPGPAITDNKSNVWQLGAKSQYGYIVLKNGSQAAGGQGDQISWKNAQIEVHNNIGDWWLWTGFGWTKSTAP